jgi:hypothetical protein
LFATESSPVQKTEKLAIAEDSKNLLYLVDSKFWRREGDSLEMHKILSKDAVCEALSCGCHAKMAVGGLKAWQP